MASQSAGGAGGPSEMKEVSESHIPSSNNYSTLYSSFQGIAPMVIQQILNAPQDGVKIFNFNYGIVKVVAIVRNIEVTSTRIIYKLEDHTGRIDAHLWLEEGSSDQQDPLIKAGKYVSIFGSVRNQNNSKAIMAFKITPVNNPNIVNTHLLEVLNTRYSAEEFSRKSNGLDTGATSAAGNGFGENQVTAGGSDNCGLTGKPLQVYKLIKENRTEEGISLSELKLKLGAKFTQHEIM